ncbi:MAG TPA: single-stranded-DNA-specific exonuclease RecJ [Terriglobales bacterium]|nr:single-stranded-DNA-specific exonuclease RecJ [Terriglobales bacterium]
MSSAARWRLRSGDAQAEELLCRELGVRPLIGRLLSSRGITTAGDAHTFLNGRLADHLSSPMLFRGMAVAADRVIQALAQGEQIGIHGDYDVDGMSGSAILIRFFRALGHEPNLFIPHRLKDGYGLKESGVRALAAAGTRLMITVDCGGCSHDEIRLARELGMETIVCDHHQVSGTPLPALAVLNPIEPDAGFPFQGLCGAGVAFYLCLGVRMRLRQQGRADLPDMRRSLDLVTLGTIADIVPLLRENRVLVKYGLRELMQSGAPGIVALKQISGVTEVSPGSVGFRLAPRLNAGGRLADARRAVELLTTSDVERAKALATELDEENRTRQQIEREMADEAVARCEQDASLAERRSIVVASADWHPGVVGIVAARLVERYHRPAIVIAIDAETGIGRGSGRSIAAVNLYRAFAQCQPCLLGFGGHHMAAGLTIAADRIEELAQAFEQAVRDSTPEAAFRPETLVDAEVSLADLDDTLLQELNRLEPFGAGNPEPVFLLRSVNVASRRIVGEQHLKLLLRQDKRSLSAIAFRMAEAALSEGQDIDVLCSIRPNHWNGQTSLETQIRAWRPATSR